MKQQKKDCLSVVSDLLECTESDENILVMSLKLSIKYQNGNPLPHSNQNKH
jgi:hypothetical protein